MTDRAADAAARLSQPAAASMPALQRSAGNAAVTAALNNQRRPVHGPARAGGAHHTIQRVTSSGSAPSVQRAYAYDSDDDDRYRSRTPRPSYSYSSRRSPSPPSYSFSSRRTPSPPPSYSSRSYGGRSRSPAPLSYGRRSPSPLSYGRRSPSPLSSDSPPSYDHVDTTYVDSSLIGSLPSRRNPSQNTVMGESAATSLRREGLHPGGTTSWLHGSAAYHHGDPVGGTPQRRDNLFAGTQDTNMEHLRYESAVSGHSGSSRRRNASPRREYGSGVDYLGVPITQIGLDGRHGNNVYDRAEYSVMNPSDPLSSTRASRRLDPYDTRPVGRREADGDLPSTHDVRRGMEYRYAHMVMQDLSDDDLPSEYRDYQRRSRRSGSRRP